MTREVYLTLIKHPETGQWTRVGPVYQSRAVAQSWIPFAKAAWHGTQAKTHRVRLTRGKDGKLLPRVLAVLDGFGIQVGEGSK